jgi:hypothetical protein
MGLVSAAGKLERAGFGSWEQVFVTYVSANDRS